jgi:hypothetical protein
LKQNRDQPNNIPLKNSILWATHLLHPLDYSSYIKETKSSSLDWSWYNALTKDDKNIEMKDFDEMKELSENSLQIMHFQEDLKHIKSVYTKESFHKELIIISF